MSELKNRVISASFILPIVFFFIMFDHYIVDIVFYLMAVFLLAKELHLFSEKLNYKDKNFSFFFIILTAIIQLFCLHTQGGRYFSYFDQVMVYAIALEILFFFLIHLFQNSFDHLYKKIQSLIFILFFTIFFLSFFLKIKYFSLHELNIEKDHISQLDNYYLLFALTSAWIYDSLAFFGGKFLGNKKLGIPVSPNKTWMGLIIGILFSPLCFFLVGYLVQIKSQKLYDNYFFSQFYLGLFISITLAILAQIGDLIGSLIKRSVGIKDSGNFMKGHGGFLDRIDSLIITTFFFYFFLFFYYS